MFLTDKRTLAAIPATTSVTVFVTYPHGLGKTPDTVIVRYNQVIASATAVGHIVALFDASNVSLQNIGALASPTMEVSAIVFHSIII